MKKFISIWFMFWCCILIALMLTFIIGVSIKYPISLFFTIPAIIYIIYIQINQILTLIYERKLSSELLDFDNVEDGKEALNIATNAMMKFQANNDTLYATRFENVCIKPIKEKLNTMGWEGDYFDRK